MRSLFSWKVFEQGLYGVQQDPEKAQQYLQIATDRGYEPGRYAYMKKQGEEYRLMREANQSKNSLFSTVPPELIDYMARMRVEATLAASQLDRSRNLK